MHASTTTGKASTALSITCSLIASASKEQTKPFPIMALSFSQLIVAVIPKGKMVV